MIPLKDTKAEEYAQHIQQLVNQLKKTSKKGIAENEAYLVPLEVAKEKSSLITLDSFKLALKT